MTPTKWDPAVALEAAKTQAAARSRAREAGRAVSEVLAAAAACGYRTSSIVLDVWEGDPTLTVLGAGEPRHRAAAVAYTVADEGTTAYIDPDPAIPWQTGAYTATMTAGQSRIVVRVASEDT
jgi:hypothetical protein